MGMSLFHVSECGCGEKVVEKIVQRPVYVNKTLPNPNPNNFNIVKIETVNCFTVVIVKYPDCTNYEGVKILVYKDLELSTIVNAKFLDPHFCENKICCSPVARFEPTEQGWNMAINFCQNWK